MIKKIFNATLTESAKINNFCLPLLKISIISVLEFSEWSVYITWMVLACWFFFGVPGLMGANGEPVLLIIRGEFVGDRWGLLLGLAVE